MERSDFARLAGLGLTVGASAAEAVVQAAPQGRARGAQPSPARKALMRVGTQHGDTDDILKVMAGFGVNLICSRRPSPRLDGQWSVNALTRLRERVESFGITLDLVPLPLSSNELDTFENPNIMLGKSPERDREIDDIRQMIRNTSRGHPRPEIQPHVPRRAARRHPVAAARSTARLCTTRRSRIRRSRRRVR